MNEIINKIRSKYQSLYVDAENYDAFVTACKASNIDIMSIEYGADGRDFEAWLDYGANPWRLYYLGIKCASIPGWK